jgi:hypothetical protein
MNILIKLMSIVSLVIAPTLAGMKPNCQADCKKPECHKETTFKKNKVDQNNTVSLFK